MFSQSLFAQLLRMGLLLLITLYVVHQYQPLLNLLAQYATNAGCHQQSATVHQQMEHH